MFAALARGGPAATLDLILTLDRPTGSTLRTSVERLGTWSWSFRHLSLAAVRLPVSRLEDLRRVDGVRGIYMNEPFHYF